MIRYDCAACGASYESPLASAGQRARCPGCGAARVAADESQPPGPPSLGPPGPPRDPLEHHLAQIGAATIGIFAVLCVGLMVTLYGRMKPSLGFDRELAVLILLLFLTGPSWWLIAKRASHRNRGER